MTRRLARHATALVIATVATACAAPAANEEPSESETALGTSSSLPAICSSPQIGDCSFYGACIERSIPCGPEGYALGYGTKYCGRFRDNAALSSAGRAWRDSVMVCLQRRLGRFLSAPLRNGATCEAVIDGAFADHPVCYTQEGASICDLPPTDWLSIVWTIDAEDLLSTRGRKQIGETARICLDRWTRALFSPFSTPAGQPNASASASASATATATATEQTRAIVSALAADPFVSQQELRALVER